jgi:hypothetical protein
MLAAPAAIAHTVDSFAALRQARNGTNHVRARRDHIGVEQLQKRASVDARKAGTDAPGRN